MIVTSLAFFLQRRLMYFPTVVTDLSVQAAGLSGAAVTDVHLRTDDGRIIKGWLLRSLLPIAPQTNASDQDISQSQRPALLIYFPGNAGNRQNRLDDLRTFATAGYDILIFDYRGYGDSQGTPTEPSMESDANQIYRYARDELRYEESRIVLFGESLGGGVALSLWSNPSEFAPQPAAIILKSTFSSMVDAASYHYPWLPVKLLLVDRWPSIDRIQHVQSSIVLIHGTRDEVVPFSHARQLQSAAPQAVLIEHQGGRHNDMPIQLMLKELQRIRSAMDE